MVRMLPNDANDALIQKIDEDELEEEKEEDEVADDISIDGSSYLAPKCFMAPGSVFGERRIHIQPSEDGRAPIQVQTECDTCKDDKEKEATKVTIPSSNTPVNIPRPGDAGKGLTQNQKYFWVATLLCAFLSGILVDRLLIHLIDKPPLPPLSLPLKSNDLLISKTDNIYTDFASTFLRLDTLNSCAYLSGTHNHQLQSESICFWNDSSGGAPSINRYPNVNVSSNSVHCGRLTEHGYCCWIRQSSNPNALTDTECFMVENPMNASLIVPGMHFAEIIGTFPDGSLMLGIRGAVDRKFAVFSNARKEISTVAVSKHFYQNSFSSIAFAFTKGLNDSLLELVEKNGEAYTCTYYFSNLLTGQSQQLITGSFELQNRECKRVPLQIPSERNAITKFRFCATDEYLALATYERSPMNDRKTSAWYLQVWFKERNMTSSVSHPIPNALTMQFELQCESAEINVFIAIGKSLQRHNIKLPIPLFMGAS